MEALKNVAAEAKYRSQEFSQLALNLAQLFISQGVKVEAYKDVGVPYFCLLDVEAKKQVIDSLGFYLELCQEQVADKCSLKDSKSLLWRMIQKMKLRPCSDLLHHVTRGQVVEIYNQYNTQVFRNSEFLEISSYTIEDIYCRPWTELYERDAFSLTQINKIGLDIYAGKCKNTMHPSIPQHLLKEKNSAFKYTVSDKIDTLSPLFDENNQVAAIIVLETADVIDCLQPREEEVLLQQDRSLMNETII